MSSLLAQHLPSYSVHSSKAGHLRASLWLVTVTVEASRGYRYPSNLSHEYQSVLDPVYHRPRMANAVILASVSYRAHIPRYPAEDTS